MSETIKITEEEMAEIKLLQSKFQESIYKLGILQTEKMELDQRVTNFVEKEKQLKDEWVSIQKLEQGLMDKISQKYGEGSLNMTDSTFTPTNPPVKVV